MRKPISSGCARESAAKFVAELVIYSTAKQHRSDKGRISRNSLMNESQYPSTPLSAFAPFRGDVARSE